MPLLVKADGVIFNIGLAPELPEDLYMLIKKVRNHRMNQNHYEESFFLILMLFQRPCPSESTSSATARTRTPSSA